MLALHTTPTPRTNTSTHRWIAQALADAIYRGRYTELRFRVEGEDPKFRTLGGSQTAFPGVFHTTTQPIPGLPAQHVKLGATDYQNALATLTRPQFDAWWAWLTPTRDTHRKLIPKPALFYADHTGIHPGTSDPLAQQAALLIANHATVTRLNIVED